MSSVTLNSLFETKIKYKINNGSWKQYNKGTKIELARKGDKVAFKADRTITGEAFYLAKYNNFSMTGKIAASGCVTSLIDEYGQRDTELFSHCFFGLFKNCTSLISAPELPTTKKLAYGCYENMFEGCSKIKINSTGTTKWTLGMVSGSLNAESCAKDMLTDTSGEVQGTPSISNTGTTKLYQ